MKNSTALLAFSILQTLIACGIYCVLESLHYLFHFNWIDCTYNAENFNLIHFLGAIVSTVAVKVFGKIIFLYLLAILLYNFLIAKNWIEPKIWISVLLFMLITIILHYNFSYDVLKSLYNLSILIHSLISMLVTSILISYMSKLIFKNTN